MLESADFDQIALEGCEPADMRLRVAQSTTALTIVGFEAYRRYERTDATCDDGAILFRVAEERPPTLPEVQNSYARLLVDADGLDLAHYFAEQCRQVWNARGAADVAKVKDARGREDEGTEDLLVKLRHLDR